MAWLLFITDEAWFHPSSYINLQNTCHCDTKNAPCYLPNPITKTENCCMVCCKCKKKYSTGPIFFCATINLEHYVNEIWKPFFEELTEEEKSCAYPQQDSAPAHTVDISVQAVQTVFYKKKIT
jgi:hypothetical protein